MLFWIYHLYSEAFCFFWLYIGLLFYPMGFSYWFVFEMVFLFIRLTFCEYSGQFPPTVPGIVMILKSKLIFWKPPEPWKTVTVSHSTDQSSQSGTSRTSIVGGLLQLVINYLLVSFNLFRYKLCFRCWSVNKTVDIIFLIFIFLFLSFHISN